LRIRKEWRRRTRHDSLLAQVTVALPQSFLAGRCGACLSNLASGEHEGRVEENVGKGGAGVFMVLCRLRKQGGDCAPLRKKLGRWND